MGPPVFCLSAAHLVFDMPLEIPWRGFHRFSPNRPPSGLGVGLFDVSPLFVLPPSRVGKIREFNLVEPTAFLTCLFPSPSFLSSPCCGAEPRGRTFFSKEPPVPPVCTFPELFVGNTHQRRLSRPLAHSPPLFGRALVSANNGVSYFPVFRGSTRCPVPDNCSILAPFFSRACRFFRVIAFPRPLGGGG